MLSEIFRSLFWVLSVYHGIHDVDLVLQRFSHARERVACLLLYGASVGAMAYWLRGATTISNKLRILYLPVGVLHLGYHDGWKRMVVTALFSFAVTDVSSLAPLYLMLVHFTGSTTNTIPKIYLVLWEVFSLGSLFVVEPWKRSPHFFEKTLITVLPAHILLHFVMDFKN